jgi:hypothetical protein
LGQKAGKAEFSAKKISTDFYGGFPDSPLKRRILLDKNDSKRWIFLLQKEGRRSSTQSATYDSDIVALLIILMAEIVHIARL